ncbi:hypothetical protein [Agrobacterium sp. LC34]|uniref:hypothetical protein n=1 Tax=Agrobacterium sp. LC34 TaxID=1643810 RepID=UPI0014858B4F|nr:hypothetical protein [Agrobacterium sp. LC34]
MKTKARNFGTSLLARLQQREMIRNLDLFTVNLELCHGSTYVLLPVRPMSHTVRNKSLIAPGIQKVRQAFHGVAGPEISGSARSL